MPRAGAVGRVATPNGCTNPPQFVVLNAEMSSSTARSHQQTASRLNGVRYSLYLQDCIAWMDRQSANSIHAMVTDPPYGLKEYTTPEKKKLRRGKGGVWRIPPSFDGCVRSPLPRFTVLTDDELSKLRHFFADFARRAFRIMVPGAHVFIATNPLLSHLVYVPLLEAGFEKRGEIIRLVQTLRGGDRPKNAHREFADVTVMPRSSWEPWGLFRKPCEGRVQDNLRKWKTGGLRRVSSELPFSDDPPMGSAIALQSPRLVRYLALCGRPNQTNEEGQACCVLAR
jgi:hypothetical protein